VPTEPKFGGGGGGGGGNGPAAAARALGGVRKDLKEKLKSHRATSADYKEKGQESLFKRGHWPHIALDYIFTLVMGARCLH